MDHPTYIYLQPGEQNEPRRRQLEAKLEAYRRRVAEAGDSPSGGVEPFWFWNDRAKLIILERLLRDGRVDRTELHRELWLNHATNPIVRYSHWQYGNPFHTAFDVIFDYVETGGANVMGGSGLPSPQ
ncbi:MAG: hypothetical protein HYY50_01210 [Candidatus Kerfeldbacteria bacterium]|nr:hypothetical protein [Candidatus Kerfeldbacteria bacterium]